MDIKNDPNYRQFLEKTMKGEILFSDLAVMYAHFQIALIRAIEKLDADTETAAEESGFDPNEFTGHAVGSLYDEDVSPEACAILACQIRLAMLIREKRISLEKLGKIILGLPNVPVGSRYTAYASLGYIKEAFKNSY